MRSSHVVLDQVEAVFDEQAVAGAGLLLPARRSPSGWGSSRPPTSSSVSPTASCGPARTQAAPPGPRLGRGCRLHR
jgi:hypothetical protein